MMGARAARSMRGAIAFERGALRSQVVARSERARQRGALRAIPTRGEVIEDGPVPFVVRMRIGAPASEAGAPSAENPFLPWDDDLFVSDVSETHVCLLNKFHVLDPHLLIVTRRFEAQETPLARADFEALWACMAEVDGLGFYNAGPIAGASQGHRHFQLLGVPLSAGPARTPVDALLGRLRFDGGVGSADEFPFLHAAARLRACARLPPGAAADVLLALYREMARAFGCDRGSRPYNLLLTRDWMLFVPRLRERWEGVPVNALGFAGALLLPDAEALARVREVGPMQVLRRVAIERGAG